MKKLLFILMCSFASTSAQAATPSLGVGAVIGEPTALSAEYRFNDERSVDFGFGYSWSHSVLLYTDYLFHFPGAFSTEHKFVNELTPYVGVGPEFEVYSTGHRKRINDRDRRVVISARVPLGMAWAIPDSPIRIFGEIVPLLNLIPGLDIDIHAGIGARFYF